MTKKYNYFTLITGGSMGIGRAIAFECAKRNMNLLLVALPGPELEETREELSGIFDIKVFSLGLDLTEKDGPQKVYDWCNSSQYKINMLINNAGLAGTAVFEKSSIAYSDDRIQLNIRALVLLTRLFLPELKELEKSYILNIGSMASFYSIPYKSIYSASKAFVRIFSLAIREELKGTSVSVSVVCPNGVQTNAGTYSRIKAHGIKGRITQISAEKLAKKCINAMLKGKGLIIPGIVDRFLLFIQKMIPFSVEQKILKREFEKEVRVS